MPVSNVLRPVFSDVTGPTTFAPSASGFDLFFERFLAYGLANGCPPLSDADLRDYNRLFTVLHDSGVIYRLSCIYEFVAPSIEWAKLNLVNPATYPITVNGDVQFTPRLGFTGDAVTGYLTIGVNENVLLSQNDAHMDVLIMAPPGAAQNNTVSTSSASGRTRLQAGRVGATNVLVRLMASSDVTISGLPLAGHVAVNRYNSSSVDVFSDGDVFVSGQASTSAAPGANAIQFLRNGPSTYSPATIGAAGLGRSLTAVQEAAHYLARAQFIAGSGGTPGASQVWYANNPASKTLRVAWRHDDTTMLQVTIGAVSSNNGLPTITRVQQALIGDPRLAEWEDVVNNATAGDFHQPPLKFEAVNDGDGGATIVDGDGVSSEFTGGGHAYLGEETTITAIGGHTDNRVKVTLSDARTWAAGQVIKISGAAVGEGLSGGINGNWAVREQIDSNNITLQGTTYNGTPGSGGSVSAYLPTAENTSWEVSVAGRVLGAEVGFAASVGITSTDEVSASNTCTTGRRALEETISASFTPGCFEFTPVKTALEEVNLQLDYGVMMKTSADQTSGYGEYADLIGADPAAIIGGTASGSARRYGPGYYGTTIESGVAASYPTERMAIASGPAGIQAIIIDPTYGIGASLANIDPASTTMLQVSASQGKFYGLVIDGGNSNTYQLHLNEGESYTYRAAVCWAPASMAAGDANAAFRCVLNGTPRYVTEFLAAGTGSLIPRSQDVGSAVSISGTAVSPSAAVLAETTIIEATGYGTAIATEA